MEKAMEKEINADQKKKKKKEDSKEQPTKKQKANDYSANKKNPLSRDLVGLQKSKRQTWICFSFVLSL